MATPPVTLAIQGRDIKVTNPDKVYFPDASGGPITKLEVVEYWAEVAGRRYTAAGTARRSSTGSPAA